ncbi:MAG: hypothetical protein S4CHLAM45_12000 [Chlamydiales bacterium]|nr:hypothetical protein [Chlamydiales bacterium]MCH9619689.1 hypothetical protein [Chlamydiales bacterium]MCH9623295.1 hypothetical protein [Chlamydiales bacterium]
MASAVPPPTAQLSEVQKKELEAQRGVFRIALSTFPPFKGEIAQNERYGALTDLKNRCIQMAKSGKDPLLMDAVIVMIEEEFTRIFKGDSSENP